jgi:hypothetical protein
LWTVLLAPWAAAGDPLPAARLFGIVLGAASAALLVWWARRMATSGHAGASGQTEASGHAGASALALWFVAASPAVAYWHLAGLEAPLVTVLLLAALAVTAAPRRWPILVTTALWTGVVLARADGIAFVATAAVIHGLHAVRRRALGAWARTWLPVACAWGAYTLWRVTTYGDFVPNTMRVKQLGDQWSLQPGLAALASAAAAHPWLLLVPWAWWHLRREAPGAGAGAGGGGAPVAQRRLAVDLGLAAIALMCLTVIGAGGDWMPLHRLVVPVLPVAAGLVAAAFASRVPALLVALALVAPVVHWTGNGPFATLVHRDNVATGAALGRALAAPPDRVLAIAAAGAAPFYSGLRTIDMSGLNDAGIAATPVVDRASGLPVGHLKGDGAAVIARRPDYLAFVLGRNERPGLDAAEIQVLFEPGFYAEYEPWEFNASRPPARARLWRATPAQARQLEYLSGMQVEGRDALGLRCVAPDRLRFVVYRRLSEAARAATPDPLRAACAAIDAAQRAGDWQAARATLARHAPVFDAVGMSSVREVMAARCAAALGDATAARRHLQAAAASAGALAAHIRLVEFVDPHLRPLRAGPGVVD